MKKLILLMTLPLLAFMLLSCEEGVDIADIRLDEYSVQMEYRNGESTEEIEVTISTWGQQSDRKVRSIDVVYDIPGAGRIILSLRDSKYPTDYQSNYYTLNGSTASFCNIIYKEQEYTGQIDFSRKTATYIRCYDDKGELVYALTEIE